jgi:NAD+ synthase (glutamine-hydrolysing)
MMQLNLHQTHISIGDFQASCESLKNLIDQNVTGLHLFPELHFSGYPLQDLVFQKEFWSRYLTNIEQLDLWLTKQKENDQLLILAGGLDYEFDENNRITHITNVIYKITPGHKSQAIYRKCLLPNYDIFDEKKYFTPGNDIGTVQFLGKNIALLICEDMWFSSGYEYDPVEALKKSKEQFDLVVNLSASPFFIGKQEKRIERACEISSELAAPFAYVNRVGGEDEIQFDGGSFIVNGDNVELVGKRFSSDLLILDLPDYKKPKKKLKSDHINTWESLFNPNLDCSHSPCLLNSLSDNGDKEVLAAVVFGISEYARKCGFKKILVALSGGIDSAVVVVLAKMTGLPVEAVYMPSLHSSSLSYEGSLKLCQNLGIKLKNFPIKFLHSTTSHGFMENFGDQLAGIADENIQSRLRGALIYTRSNQTGAMVLNTSNKSELAVGYSTQYGDSVGAISPLGDLYKSEVYHLAELINKDSEIIPREIIDRPPTAELRPDQKDEESLPPYERLDAILEGFLSYRFTREDLIKHGHAKEEVKKVYDLYTKSEYKRNQFGPIIKLRPKSFGFGYRVPITARKK